VKYPVATTHFHPLFLYESLSGLAGALVLLWLARRRTSRLVSGDLLLIFFVWYGLTRFALEGLRSGNWTFFGIPTAQIVTLGFILAGVLGLWYRHGPGRPSATATELLPDRASETIDDDEDAFWADDDADGADDADDDEAEDQAEDKADDDADDADDAADDDEADDEADLGAAAGATVADAPITDRPAPPG
jgi:hypothetical protein